MSCRVLSAEPMDARTAAQSLLRVTQTLRRRTPGRFSPEAGGLPQQLSPLAILTEAAAVITAGGLSGMCM